MLGGELAAYFSMTVSPEETRLAAGTVDGQIRLWDLTAVPPQELGSFRAHREFTDRLGFTADGNTLFSRGSDGLRMWEAPPLEKLLSSKSLMTGTSVSPGVEADRAFLGELGGVGEQVEQRLADLRLVGALTAEVGGTVHTEHKNSTLRHSHR
jgi:hypothetical protein